MSKIPQNICRICEQINELINILQSEYQWLIDKYISCANVTFDINDELPKYFCKNCIENLQSAHEFKEKCEYTHNKFMKLVENSFYEDAANEKPQIPNHTNVIIKHEWDDDQKPENNFINVMMESDYDEINNEEKHINAMMKSEYGETNKTKENHINVVDESHRQTNEKLINIKIEKKLPLKLTKTKKTFECYMCPTMEFNTKKSIQRHMRNEHKFLIEINLKQTCDLCNKTFCDYYTLLRHKKTVHLGIKPKRIRTDTPCEHCNKRFATLQSRNRHVRTVHHDEKLFVCKLCGKSYSQMHTLKTHHLSVHLNEKQFKCDQCPNMYATKKSLLLHIVQHLPADNEQRLTILGKQKQYQDKHKQKSIVCEICGKSISVISIAGHRLMHKGLKPHKCEICSKSFRTKREVKDHSQMHTDIRPYKCELCEKTFRRSSNLRAHSVIHSGQKPYKCLVCNKEFWFGGNFRLHSRIHTGETPYSCKLCSKKFSNSGALRKHVSSHHNDQQSIVKEEHKTTFESTN